MKTIKERIKSKRLKWILAVVLIVIVSAVTTATFVTMNKEKTTNIADHEIKQTSSASDNETEHTSPTTGSTNQTEQNVETSVPPRPSYPIENWEIEIPYLNPFGSQDLYQSVQFTANQRKELRYVDEQNKEMTRQTGGDTWELVVNWEDDTVNPYEDLIQYVTELGGQFYRGLHENEWILTAQDDEGNRWWASTTSANKGYKLTVYKERILRGGETFTFQTAEFENNELFFITENNKHLYQSMLVAFPDGQVRVKASNHYTEGQYSKALDYSKTLYAYKAKQYALSDFPQDTHTPIQWTVSWSNNSDPQEISITLDESEHINPIVEGESLGALKVRANIAGHIRVDLPNHVSIIHPELHLRGDKTPEGDTLFWLPSGYWNVTFVPEILNSNAKMLNTRLVPINSGEMTTLDMHPLVNQAYNRMGMDEIHVTDRQLKILEMTEEGKQATVSFMHLDPSNDEFVPNMTNTEIMEGGKLGEIIKLERVQTPPHVVLALDSSGSMAASMTAVLQSARDFIQGLPDQTVIQVIDFDSGIRLLPGNQKEEVLQSLNQVRAEGATTLYDATLQGLELLKEKERPTLVVFTDGVDSNTENNDSGSKADKQDVEKAVLAAGIPLYTIGFGEGHDAKTMMELAEMSGGTYFSAADTQVLDLVFTAINQRLGNQYIAVYERPEEIAPSDTPVISLAVDVSLSMDLDPSFGNGDYRLDKVKNLLHTFVQQTPEPSLMQLISFSNDVQVEQVFTHRKSEITQALGELKARGGTNILQSTELTYQSLENIPSNKKVIVYITDAALAVDDKSKDYFESLLAGIKDDGVIVLWVGLGTEDSEEAFQWAAKKSGGDYVISEDPDVLTKALQKAIQNAQQKKEEGIPLSLVIQDRSEKGNPQQYAASAIADFPVRTSANETIALTPIGFETGEKVLQYEADAASLVSGGDLPGEEVQIYKRLPLQVTQKNGAMEMTAHEIYYLKRLKGVEIPKGRSFVAVDLSLKNIHPEGIPYLIPDYASHFFLSMNEQGSYPASTATWLAETPLAPPGKNDITIQPDETIRGVLVFLIPDEVTEQAGIHFYDTSHGHMTLALLGTPAKDEIQLTSLPTKLTGKLSDTYSMTILATSELDKIEDVELVDQDSVFKIIEAEMNSQVQALLKLNPQERFYLKLNTEYGAFMAPVNTATALLPHGFIRPVTMGPGSSNKVRFAFQIPRAMKDASMDLYADLLGGGMQLVINEQQVNLNDQGQSHQGEHTVMRVNALSPATSVGGRSGNFVVADITVIDEKDGSGTSGYRSSFRLVSGQGEAKQIVHPDAATDELLFGIDQNWKVFDGSTKRGLLVFRLPRSDSEERWTLQSSLFETLDEPLGEQPYQQTEWLVNHVNPKLDEHFDTALSLALMEVIRKYEAMAADQSAANVDRSNVEESSVSTPFPAVYGLQEIAKVEDFADFKALLGKIQWLPASERQWYFYRNSPESVITQGWGTEIDLANLAGRLLAKLGYRPSLRYVTVTNEGREALQELGRVDEVTTTTLPAWVYRDLEGKTNVFVVPFMKELSELNDWVYLPGGQSEISLSPEEASISVYYQAVPIDHSSGVQGITGALSGALAGDTGDSTSEPQPQDLRMLQTTLPLDQLGNEPLDLRVGSEDGLYTAVLENQLVQIVGDNTMDPSQYKVTSVRIEVSLRGGQQVHETKLGEGEEIFGLYQTLAIQLPDMIPEATAALQRTADRIHKDTVKADDQSTLSWYTRNILYRFVANQTIYERQLAKELQVTAGRTNKERVIVVTVKRKDEQSSLLTSINLLQSANELHRSTEEAARAFQIMSGLFASRLEGQVLLGNKADFMEVWSRSPEDTNLFLSLPSNRKDDLVYMEELGVPATLMQKAKDTNNAFFIPTKPTRIYGENRWAWLEVDPATYETIAVFDTGEHGGFAEFLLTMQRVSPTSDDYQAFMAGSFIGVSSSVWGVSAFSLVLEDYEEILDAAQAYVIGLGETLSGLMDNKDLPKLELNMSPFKVKLDNVDFDYLAGMYQDVKAGKEIKLSPDVVGFGLGFKAGVAHYFKQAREGLE